MSIKTLFQNIADAIKTKDASIASLTPSQMPDAIINLPSGGGVGESIEPSHALGDNGGFVASGDWYRPASGTSTVIYPVEHGKSYLFRLFSPVGNRFRGALFSVDPATADRDLTGLQIMQNDNPTVNVGIYFISDRDGYFAAGLSNTGDTTIRNELIGFTEDN